MQVIDLWIISLIDSQRSIPEHVKTARSRCKYDRVCHVFFLTGRANPHIAQILCSANESGDLLKLLDMDSSLTARKELAAELGCPADLMGDSAKMNIWLHKRVMKELAAHGGKVPANMLD